MKSKIILFIVVVLCFFSLPAHSAVYHIDPTATSGGNGTARSPFRHWTNLPKMVTGDDVFFKCGTTSFPKAALSVNWEGTKSNPVVIGAYYLKNGTPVYGVSGPRPIISGGNYSVPSNACKAKVDSWYGLIHVSNKNNIHIKNLHVYKSGFHGILVSGDLKNATSSANFLIHNVKVEGSYWQGILIANNKNNYGIVEHCEVSGASYAWKNGCAEGITGALTVANSPFANTIIRRNYVHENWGEGIGSNRIPGTKETNHSGHATIEDNIIWNNRRVDIYLDRTENNIVRRNLCIGKNDKAFLSIKSENRPWNQSGIWVNMEHTSSRGSVPSASNNNQVYSNLIAGHYKGISLASAYTSGSMEGNVFYNNTLIGNRFNFDIGHKLADYTIKNVIFKNNISYCPPDTICQDVNADHAWYSKKFITNNNAWTKKPKNLSSPNDILVNNNWNKTKGWQALSSPVNAIDFKMTKDNPCIGKSVSIGGISGHSIDPEKTNYSFRAPLNISVITLSSDYRSQYDMGAVAYAASTGTNNLPAPVLSIIPD